MDRGNNTLGSLLDEGVFFLQEAGIQEAKLDAWYLLSRAFHTDRAHFLMDRHRILDSEVLDAGYDGYMSMLGRRAARIPLQQILGCQEFMGLEFEVNEHVLIPRQDTETLVELVLQERPDKEQDILDMCTGSGCIAVSLAKLGAYRSVTAVDVSEQALAVAKRNGSRHAGERIRWIHSDMFDGVTGVFDVITSNPPYIPSRVIGDLEPEVRDHEPRLALDGMEDGLYFYRRLAKLSSEFLKPGGSVYLEIGHDQGEAVSGMLTAHGFRNVEVFRDSPGLDRVVRGTLN